MPKHQNLARDSRSEETERAPKRTCRFIYADDDVNIPFLRSRTAPANPCFDSPLVKTTLCRRTAAEEEGQKTLGETVRPCPFTRRRP